MAYTTASLVQMLIAATIPLVFLGVLFNRVIARRKMKWKQVKMTTVLMLAPAVVLFGVRGILPKWMALGSGLVIVALALMVSSNND